MRRFRVTAYDGADCHDSFRFRATSLGAARKIAIAWATQFAVDLGDSWAIWILYDKRGDDVDSGVARIPTPENVP